MDKTQVRLSILSMVIPQASRVSITDPAHIIKTCTDLEKYVLDSEKGENLSDSPAKRAPGRPKRTTEHDAVSSSDPTHGG
jgi:hypothetical protein